MTKVDGCINTEVLFMGLRFYQILNDTLEITFKINCVNIYVEYLTI